ncbi:tetratricopeptide repeat protein [Minwuia sp.]|uniref:tetratricopeptide repeat protein n=1 Tax=Minwuia sp. TaxID=2493630 RepID=UPI003A937AA0
MHRTFAIVALTAALAAGAVAIVGQKQSADGSRPVASGGSVAALETAVQRNPDHADSWRKLARAYRAAGETKKALNAYVRASRIEPSDRETILALQDIARALRP